VVIVKIRDERTNYVLNGSVNQGGDLVLAGSDLSPSIKEMFDTDEYEYFYVVKAHEVKRVCAALGADAAGLLERVRDQLAPHGITASTAWKAWLTAHGIPYEFSVWR
jgi:hypothetical protein